MIKQGKIQGVLYKELIIHPDDRGFFMEVAKEGSLFIPIKQTSFTVTHPNVIKAFHWHKKQTDLWFGISGRARAVLYDLRENSSTKGQFEEFFIGDTKPMLLLIPPGVAHGYQVLGNKDFSMIYHTDQTYNPTEPDEQRIAFDKLGFDWSIKNR